MMAAVRGVSLCGATKPSTGGGHGETVGEIFVS